MSIISYTLLGVTAYVRVIAYYSINVMILMAAAAVCFLLLAGMYHDFLPEQVADLPQADS